jgi:hypothetical protein
MDYYTYAYLRKDGTPYYIGKGTGRRINQYHTKFVKLPSKDSRVILERFNTEKEALEHEIELIALYGRKDIQTGILINRTNGGDNPPKNDISGWNKGLEMNFGPERGKRISRALKGRTKSEEHRKALSEVMRGKDPWNKGKSRFKNEEEKLQNKREYNRLRSKRIRDSLKSGTDPLT